VAKVSTEKKKTILIIYDSLLYGGIQTQIIDIAKWAYNNGHRMVWAVTKYAKWEESSYNILLENNVEIVMVQRIFDNLKSDTSFYSLKNSNAKRIFLEPDEELLIISYNFYAFFFGEAIKHTYRNNNIDNFFIVPHETNAYLDIRFSEKYKLPIVGGFFTRFYSKIVQDMVKNNCIIYLVDSAVSAAKEHYKKVKFGQIAPKPIGRYIKEYDEQKIREIYRKNDEFTILTIGRYTFPFKGYVFGVIDSYKELKDKGYKVKLNIIGYGSGEARVVEKINQLPTEYKSDIKLLGKKPLDELNLYYEGTKVYVGTGYTLWQACESGIISIVATVYQDGKKTGGFFNIDRTDPLCYDGAMDLTENIEKIMCFSEDEYIKISKIAYERHKATHDIEYCMDTIICERNKNVSANISKIQIYMLKFLFIGKMVYNFVCKKL